MADPAALRGPRPRPLLRRLGLEGAGRGDGGAEGEGEAGARAREAVLAHLRAFGPAGADDVAQWLGWKVGPVKEALEAADGLEELQDGRRTVHDLAGAPRPDGDTEAPVRFLAAFDSVILAYAPKRRTRIVPEGRFEAIYNRANLQIRPTFLVDGFVAGTWSSQVKGRKGTVTITPFGRLPRGSQGRARGRGGGAPRRRAPRTPRTGP